MEKCYDGVYERNIDTLYPKRDFLRTLVGRFLKFISLKHRTVAKCTESLFRLFFVFNENLEK